MLTTQVEVRWDPAGGERVGGGAWWADQPCHQSSCCSTAPAVSILTLCPSVPSRPPVAQPQAPVTGTRRSHGWTLSPWETWDRWIPMLKGSLLSLYFPPWLGCIRGNWGLAHWVPTLQGEAPEGTIWGAQAQLSAPADRCSAHVVKLTSSAFQTHEKVPQVGLEQLPRGAMAPGGFASASGSLMSLSVAADTNPCCHGSELLNEKTGVGRALGGLWLRTFRAALWAPQQQLLGICQKRTGVRWEVQEGWVRITATSAPLGFWWYLFLHWFLSDSCHSSPHSGSPHGVRGSRGQSSWTWIVDRESPAARIQHLELELKPKESESKMPPSTSWEGSSSSILWYFPFK